MRWWTGALTLLVLAHVVAVGLTSPAGACDCHVPYARFELELEAAEVTSGDYPAQAVAEQFDGPVTLDMDAAGYATLHGHRRGAIGLEAAP